MNATEKEQSQRSVSSSSARQSEFKDPGGLRSEETGEDREMELGWKSTARRVNQQRECCCTIPQYKHPLNAPSKKERANDTEILLYKFQFRRLSIVIPSICFNMVF